MKNATNTKFMKSTEGVIFCDVKIKAQLTSFEIACNFVCSMICEDDDTIRNAWNKASATAILNVAIAEIAISGEARHYQIGDEDRVELAEELEIDFFKKFKIERP